MPASTVGVGKIADHSTSFEAGGKEQIPMNTHSAPQAAQTFETTGAALIEGLLTEGSRGRYRVDIGPDAGVKDADNDAWDDPGKMEEARHDRDG